MTRTKQAAATAADELTNEYTPKSPEPSDEPILYDARLEQKIPFTLNKSGREFRVSHTLRPLSDERYFEFREAIEATESAAKKISTKLWLPKVALWKDLVVSREGFVEKPDWKETTHQSIASAVVEAYLHAAVLNENEEEAEDGEEILYDDEAPTKISFRAMQAGALLTLSHSFLPETKAQMDEYIAIETAQPIPNTLASAAKRSTAEKLCKLGRQLLVETDGYAEGSHVPGWHLATTTESYFLRRLAQVGK